ncbi:MAG: hypothetical protein EAX96_01265 [Candidatus Lokiarchaeota archaeon]|nr:hypothetical protein [Candidatus Lokiarchaeota archaeon]
MFHHVFIVEKTGICIFHKCFDGMHDHINKDLFSGFFTALFDFSKEMFSNTYYDFIDLIDFGEKRFIIIEDAQVFFIAMIDTKDSTIAAFKKLKRFKNSFMYKYGKILSQWTGRIDDFKGIDELLEKVDKFDRFDYLNPNLLSQLNKTLLEKKVKYDEIKGICILTMTGVPQITINITNELVTAIIKEIELRWKSRIENIHKIIFILGSEESTMMQNIKNKIILAVNFKSGTNLGMTDLIMEELVESVKNFDLKKI